MTTAPIALFVYKRLDHVRRTVAALRQNDLASDSDLLVFSDGPRDEASAPLVEEVRRYLKSVNGFLSIRIKERSSNAGLAASIIQGVTEVCEEYGRVIVLEDDLVTGRGFLSYMNRALDLYAHDDVVASVHGYCYPVAATLPETFFLRGADCWGWATWARAWKDFDQNGPRLLSTLYDRGLHRELDFDGAYGFTEMLKDCVAGKNDSWAIRWHVSCFLHDKLTLYPARSLVQNIGTDGTGTHCSTSDLYGDSVSDQPIRVERIELLQSAEAREAFRRFLRGARTSVIRRALGRISNLRKVAR